MAARLLDHFMILRTVILEERRPSAAPLSRAETGESPGQVHLLKHQALERRVGDDARYAALQACMVTPHDSLEQAQDRAWDLAQSLAADHHGVHPWALLMTALRGALSAEDRADAQLVASLDDLETYGVLFWDGARS